MSRLTRDGTAEPVSLDLILWRERGGTRKFLFSCSADQEQDWQPYPVDTYCAISDDIYSVYIYIYRYGHHYVCMYGHTYSKSVDQPGKVANPARGQLNRGNEYYIYFQHMPISYQ